MWSLIWFVLSAVLIGGSLGIRVVVIRRTVFVFQLKVLVLILVFLVLFSLFVCLVGILLRLMLEVIDLRKCPNCGSYNVDVVKVVVKQCCASVDACKVVTVVYKCNVCGAMF